MKFGGFADGWSETNPDSEQIEYTVAKPQIRNSVSVEQIQEESSNAHHKKGSDFCYFLFYLEVLIARTSVEVREDFA